MVLSDLKISKEENAENYKKYLAEHRNQIIELYTVERIVSSGEEPLDRLIYKLNADGNKFKLTNSQLYAVLGNHILIGDESDNAPKWVEIKPNNNYDSTVVAVILSKEDETIHRVKMCDSLLKVAFSVNPEVQRRGISVAIRTARFECATKENPYYPEFQDFLQADVCNNPKK